MKDKVYIMGHRNPDSDSICSAIAYADYKNSLGEYEAVPVRLGNVSRETQFILDYFGVEKPKLKTTVRLLVEDLEYDKIAPISPEIPVKMALNIMEKNNINSIPVVDEEDRLAGVITASDIIKSYADVWDSTILGKSGASFTNIVSSLAADVINEAEDFNIKGKIVILAMDANLSKDYLESGDVAICGNRKDSQLAAIDRGAALIVVTGGNEVEDDVLKLAKEKNISVISTALDTFTASRLITQAIPVEYTMSKEDLVYFYEDELVDDVKSEMTKTRYRSYPVLDRNNKVLGLISRYHLITSKKKKIIQVDHNERRQSIDGIDEAEILEIIDHHRVADVFTGNPIYFRNEPVGCTATIITSIMFENGRKPSKKIAGLLASAIISDTLLLRSPTTTERDAATLEKLASIAGIDPEKYALEMFKAGTSLVGKTPEEILTQDFKEFTIDNNKIAIAQVFTMDLDSIDSLKDDLVEAMEVKKNEAGYAAFILLLTDIFKEASEIVVVGDKKDLVAKAFGKTIEDNSFYTPGVVSRKKQVVPPVTNALITKEDN